MRKNNKRAFTLIELLAVIVILAIIALIATPIILGIVEDARRDSFMRSVELVINATDIDIFGKNYTDTYTYTITDGVVSNLEVGVKNTDGMNGSITYDKNGNDTYAIHNGKYCVIKTSTMNKAEIKDYVEGECELGKVITTYANGQIVYFDVDKGVGCTMEEYASSYDVTVGDFQNSLTGYNGLNGEGKQNSCLLFYAFNDEDEETLNLILDHNTTGTTYWTDSNTRSNANGPIEVLRKLKTATNSWKGTITPDNYIVTQTGTQTGYGNYTIPYSAENYKARLITAQEIARITGADTKEGLLFDESTTSYINYFYFDSLTNTPVDTCKRGNIIGCQYGWLYDRTGTDCEKSGCLNNADSGMTGYGYWTGTSAIGGSNLAWIVGIGGDLDVDDVFGYGFESGVRPVITVLKSNISPGEEPVMSTTE